MALTFQRKIEIPIISRVLAPITKARVFSISTLYTLLHLHTGQNIKIKKWRTKKKYFSFTGPPGSFESLFSFKREALPKKKTWILLPYGFSKFHYFTIFNPICPACASQSLSCCCCCQVLNKMAMMTPHFQGEKHAL